MLNIAITTMPQQNSKPYYESIEFTLDNGQTDYDLDAEQATFLSVFNQEDHQLEGVFPTKMVLRTDKTISFKMNSTSSHAITVASTDSPWEEDGIQIKNVYLTNASGSDAAVKLEFHQSPHRA